MELVRKAKDVHIMLNIPALGLICFISLIFEIIKFTLNHISIVFIIKKNK